MEEKKDLFDLLKGLKPYWLQVTTIIVLVSSVFGYGLNTGLNRAARSLEKKEIRSLKDSIVFYYQSMHKLEVQSLNNRDFKIDSLRKEIGYYGQKVDKYSIKVDLLINSYKESLKINPQISKEQYLTLTQRIDNLLDELKKND